MVNKQIYAIGVQSVLSYADYLNIFSNFGTPKIQFNEKFHYALIVCYLFNVTLFATNLRLGIFGTN